MANLQYKTERSTTGGFRFDVKNPPEVGSKLVLRDGRVATFDGIGMAGMLECTDGQGHQHLVFPHDIQGPFVPAFPLGDADLTHL